MKMKIEIDGLGAKSLKTEVEFTDLEPKPNQEHPDLTGVRPLFVMIKGKKLFPTFQREESTNVLYKNVSNCLMCFRATGSQNGWGILLWFTLPNENLDWKTPVEVGRHPKKDVRNQIVAAAELDAPLKDTKNTW